MRSRMKVISQKSCFKEKLRHTSRSGRKKVFEITWQSMQLSACSITRRFCVTSIENNRHIKVGLH